MRHIKRTLVTAVTLFAVTAARASDLAVTFHYNPSLSREANPIVSYFGAGAHAMLVADIVLVIVILFVPLFVYWRGSPKRFRAKPESMWDFAALYLYERAMSRGQLLRAIVFCWPLPKDWLQVLRLWGLAGSWAVVVGSFAAVFSWWALWGLKWSAYRVVYATFSISHYPLIVPIVALVGGAFGAVTFFRLEYAEREATDV
jgi:hypothetical protein